MAKKKRNFYSTNPDYEYVDPEDQNRSQNTFPPQQQKLYVLIDRKKRRGKEVTLVTGFIGSTDDLKDLGKLLKSKCGVGGSVKDGEILIQGNKREQVMEILLKEGYSQTKRSGS